MTKVPLGLLVRPTHLVRSDQPTWSGPSSLTRPLSLSLASNPNPNLALAIPFLPPRSPTNSGRFRRSWTSPWVATDAPHGAAASYPRRFGKDDASRLSPTPNATRVAVVCGDARWASVPGIPGAARWLAGGVLVAAVLGVAWLGCGLAPLWPIHAAVPPWLRLQCSSSRYVLLLALSCSSFISFLWMHWPAPVLRALTLPVHMC
jgi:hypothetical protein